MSDLFNCILGVRLTSNLLYSFKDIIQSLKIPLRPSGQGDDPRVYEHALKRRMDLLAGVSMPSWFDQTFEDYIMSAIILHQSAELDKERAAAWGDLKGRPPGLMDWEMRELRSTFVYV